MRDQERVQRITRELGLAQLDAIVCALPMHVLLLTGYWPVIGVSLAIATRDGRIVLLVPEDEEELASAGWADEVHAFHPSSLDHLVRLEHVVAHEWKQLSERLGLFNARIGYESGPVSEPAPYVAVNLYGAGLLEVLKSGCGRAQFVPADEIMARLMSVKTPGEIERIRAACHVARQTFVAAARSARLGVKETDAAASLRRHLSVCGPNDGSHRADGYIFCMSGPNSAKASGAYARSRQRTISTGDLVLVHCNSYVDGYWTDITRTYSVGNATPKHEQIYEAVFEARRAALEAIQPGVPACAVDEAARSVLASHGFANEFKHSTGHGVGFAAISAHARPQIHPASQERLAPGMVFNVEPAVYIDGYGGVRHCDMVVVTGSGYELLTPFQTTAHELRLVS